MDTAVDERIRKLETLETEMAEIEAELRGFYTPAKTIATKIRALRDNLTYHANRQRVTERALDAAYRAIDEALQAMRGPMTLDDARHARTILMHFDVERRKAVVAHRHESA